MELVQRRLVKDLNKLFGAVRSAEEDAEYGLSWNGVFFHPWVVRIGLMENEMDPGDFFNILERGNMLVDVLLFNSMEERREYLEGELKVINKYKPIKLKTKDHENFED